MLGARGRTRSFVVKAANGPLPGARQTNDRRAELWAFISPSGELRYWTDSEITCVGWNARRGGERGGTGTNCDLWRSVGKALE
eukprot:1191420-Pyramimonas_sp.AAC.1